MALHGRIGDLRKESSSVRLEKGIFCGLGKMLLQRDVLITWNMSWKMLSKGICIECWNTTRAVFSWKNWPGSEECWSAGRVLCPDWTWAFVDEKPPLSCPFYLEHCMANSLVTSDL